MDVHNIDIKISEELVLYLYAIKADNSITDKANLSLILGLFVSKAVTLEKTAELAEKPVWNFIDLLKSYQIPWGEYIEEEMQIDETAMNKILGELYDET